MIFAAALVAWAVFLTTGVTSMRKTRGEWQMHWAKHIFAKDLPDPFAQTLLLSTRCRDVPLLLSKRAVSSCFFRLGIRSLLGSGSLPGLGAPSHLRSQGSTWPGLEHPQNQELIEGHG